MFYLIIFPMAKRGTWRHQSRDQSVLNILVRFYSTFFAINWQVFVVVFFSGNLYTVLPLSNYYSIFKAERKFKYLGVLLDNTLSWKDHVEYIGNKISSRLGILRRARKVLPKPTCQMLYNTLVLPLLAYFSPFWDSCGVGSKAYLDKLNRRAACIIGGRSIGADELKSTLGWPGLQLSLIHISEPTRPY